MGPNLLSISINLFEEDQVDYLLRNLPNLENLNGLKVERDALFNDEEDSEEEQYQVVNDSINAQELVAGLDPPEAS